MISNRKKIFQKKYTSTPLGSRDAVLELGMRELWGCSSGVLRDGSTPEVHRRYGGAEKSGRKTCKRVVKCCIFAN